MLLSDVMLRRLLSQDVLHEAFPGIPIAEIAGDRRVLVENHFGVSEYDTQRIGIRVKYGWLYICGRNLTLASMNKQQLVVSGHIDSVSLQREEKAADE